MFDLTLMNCLRIHFIRIKYDNTETTKIKLIFRYNTEK